LKIEELLMSLRSLFKKQFGLSESLRDNEHAPKFILFCLFIAHNQKNKIERIP